MFFIERRERSEGYNNPSSLENASGNCDLLPCSFLSSPFNIHSSIYWFTVDRHGLRPRDDKSGIFTMKGVKKIGYISCHCEERTK